MRIYISGPFDGLKAETGEKYRLAEKIIEKKFPGTEYINPWITCVSASLTARLTKTDLKKIRHALIDICDSIYFLDDWELSDECHEEWIYAQNTNMKVVKE